MSKDVAEGGRASVSAADGAFRDRENGWYGRLCLPLSSTLYLPPSSPLCPPQRPSVSHFPASSPCTQRLVKAAGIYAPMVGHVGDGNFHMMMVLDTNNRWEDRGRGGLRGGMCNRWGYRSYHRLCPLRSVDEVFCHGLSINLPALLCSLRSAELAAAQAVSDAMVHMAQGMGGTCTGEHGVGYGKLGFLQAEHGAAALQLMGGVKRAIDPLGSMNPGKMGHGPLFGN